MIEFFLLLAFRGASSALSIVPLATQLHASLGDTALLPISIRSLDPSWEYFYLTWHFASQNRPILVFIVEQCQGAAHRWWEPPCQLKLDVAQEYEQRADVSPQNGSLVLQGLRAEDTGTYRVTVRGSQGQASADLDLMVTDGASSALSIVPLATQLHASLGDTALLPISIRSLDPSWEYFYLTWHFASQNHPILVFIVEQCQGAAHRWWEPPCQLKLDVAQEYEQRADISPQNGSLVLQGLRAEDTGTYRVTVRGSQGQASADLDLMVTDAASRAAQGGLSVGNTIRLGLGGLVLCVLGLIVTEFVCSNEQLVQPKDTV